MSMLLKANLQIQLIPNMAFFQENRKSSKVCMEPEKSIK